MACFYRSRSSSQVQPRTTNVNSTRDKPGSTPESSGASTYRPGTYLQDHPDPLHTQDSSDEDLGAALSGYSSEAPFYGFSTPSSGQEYVSPASRDGRRDRVLRELSQSITPTGPPRARTERRNFDYSLRVMLQQQQAMLEKIVDNQSSDSMKAKQSQLEGKLKDLELKFNNTQQTSPPSVSKSKKRKLIVTHEISVSH